MVGVVMDSVVIDLNLYEGESSSSNRLYREPVVITGNKLRVDDMTLYSYDSGESGADTLEMAKYGWIDDSNKIKVKQFIIQNNGPSNQFAAIYDGSGFSEDLFKKYISSGEWIMFSVDRDYVFEDDPILFFMGNATYFRIIAVVEEEA
jgi:hypothetical protein